LRISVYQGRHVRNLFSAIKILSKSLPSKGSCGELKVKHQGEGYKLTLNPSPVTRGNHGRAA
jgi:hypothetical protein